MKCPNDLRQCPHGWTGCELCANLKACEAGAYEPEPETPETEESDIDILLKAAEVSERVMQAEVVASVTAIKGTVVEKYSKLEGDEWWRAFGERRAADLHVKEPLPLDGGVVHGGGSKSKVKKKPSRKMPEYLKSFGQ